MEYHARIERIRVADGVHAASLMFAGAIAPARSVQRSHDLGRTTAMSDNTDSARPSAAEQMLGDFAPGLVHFTDDVLFGEVWKRPQLSPRDPSLITVAALVAGGNAEQLTFHLQFAEDNGATEDELIEAITHLAFYAGWPKAFSAITIAKRVFGTT